MTICVILARNLRRDDTGEGVIRGEIIYLESQLEPDEDKVQDFYLDRMWEIYPREALEARPACFWQWDGPGEK